MPSESQRTQREVGVSGGFPDMTEIIELRVTVQPNQFALGRRELSVRLYCTGQRMIESSKMLLHDDFTSDFEFLMDNAKEELLRMVKAKEVK